MERLPRKINSIIRSSNVYSDYKYRYIYYTINEDEESQCVLRTKLPLYGRPFMSKEIIDDSHDFVNGFKVVLMATKEYAYIRQSDNKLLPFRYDVASDFNEYGFAMVGKDASTSWIDTDFKYLSFRGKMVEEDINNIFVDFNGFQGVREFSKGAIPLSKVYYFGNRLSSISYFGIDGQLKEFCEFDGQLKRSCPLNRFNEGTDFDENGYANADGKILFARGYYCDFNDMLNICEQKGFLDIIRNDAEECLNIEEQELQKLKAK